MLPTDKIVIVDLEATCWENKEHKPTEMETIEIGAVKIDSSGNQKIEDLDLFVKPVRHPVLSDFCKNLTSITQEAVDSAKQFPEVWRQFLDWLGEPESFYLASWGVYDPKQLIQDCRLHKLDYAFYDKHINLKKLFGVKYGGRKFGMKGALYTIGLELEGTYHRGIDDARNIYRIYKWMLSNTC